MTIYIWSQSADGYEFNTYQQRIAENTCTAPIVPVNGCTQCLGTGIVARALYDCPECDVEGDTILGRLDYAKCPGCGLEWWIEFKDEDCPECS